MNRTIVDAITNKHILHFIYHGERRAVEPHCYGVDTNGHEALRAWQQGKGWRLFHVSDIWQLTEAQHTFAGARPDYNPNDRQMIRIFAAL